MSPGIQDDDQQSARPCLEFPCIPLCNCKARRVLNLIRVTTTECCLQTLQELRVELEAVFRFQSETAKFSPLDLLKVEGDRYIFLEILDQSLEGGRATSEYSIRCKRVMKKLSCELQRLPSSFYETGVTVTERKVKNSGCASIHMGMLNGKMIAIKEPRPPSPHDVSAFYREAITWRYLEFEFILPFLGVAEVDVYGPCLLSPWMEKGDIADYLNNNDASDEQLIDFNLQTVQGIEYLHKNAIVHADIKPQNILIDCHNRVLVADVGVAYLGDICTITDEATRNAANGTWFYMAPELRQDAQHDARIRSTKESDVFALGVTIYEILTGTKRREGITWKNAGESMKTKTRNGSVIAKRAQKAIFQCWQENVQWRPTVPQLLAKLQARSSIFTTASETWQQKAALELMRMMSLPGFEPVSYAPVVMTKPTSRRKAIIVMGPSGAGKTSFVNILTNAHLRVNHRLGASPGRIQHGTHTCKRRGGKLYMVDTPRIERSSDWSRVQSGVFQYLAQTFIPQPEIIGIIYLHRIDVRRVTDLPSNYAEIFEEYCGPNFREKVIFLTTGWSTKATYETARRYEENEDAFRAEWFHTMLSRGATMLRYHNNANSAWVPVTILCDREGGPSGT